MLYKVEYLIFLHKLTSLQRLTVFTDLQKTQINVNLDQ